MEQHELLQEQANVNDQILSTGSLKPPKEMDTPEVLSSLKIKLGIYTKGFETVCASPGQ